MTEAFCGLVQKELLENVDKGISAFIYTQLSDVEEETNGLLTYDREIIKMDMDRVREINESVK